MNNTEAPQHDDDQFEEMYTTDDSNVHQMKRDLEETTKILEIVAKFEADYFQSKAKYNQLDAITINSDINIKTMSHCYKLLRKNVVVDYPNFDKIGMAANLNKVMSQIKKLNSQYSQIKGEYIAVQDQILNKDTFTLKLARAEYAKEKQNQILQKIEQVDSQIYENEAQVNKIKVSYEDFEQSVFEEKFGTIKTIREEVINIFDKVYGKYETMKEHLNHVAPIIEQMKPRNREEGKQVDRFRQEVFDVQQTFKKASNIIEYEEMERKKLLAQYDQSFGYVDDVIKYSPWQDNEKLNLVQLVKQTRTIEVLCANQNGWTAQLSRIKQLHIEQVSVGEKKMYQTKQDAIDFVASTCTTRKRENDEVAANIKKQSDLNGKTLQIQKERLEKFETYALDPEIAHHVSDQDVLFISKEINRFKSAIISSEALKEAILKDSRQINSQHEVNGIIMVHPDDIVQLKVYLKDLQKQQDTNIDAIIKNIDMLDAFSKKALASKLIDENKIAAAKVISIKKTFEEIEKQILKMNSKIKEAQAKYQKVDKELDNEDLEKENALENMIVKQIKDCYIHINGQSKSNVHMDVGNANQDDVCQHEKMDLEASRSQVEAMINLMMAQFNENHLKIKDATKRAVDDKERNELLKTNSQIQQECQQIISKMELIQLQITDIDSRINEIDDQIVKLANKYTLKSKLVNECDQLYDQNEAMAKLVEQQINDLGKSISCTCQKVHDVSPLNTPSRTSQNNQEFIKDISHKHETGQQLKDQLSLYRDKLAKLKDKLDNHIQPLNEIGEREIHQPEVEQILKVMKDLNSEFQMFENHIKPIDSQSFTLKEEFESLISAEKRKKVIISEAKLNVINKQIDDFSKGCSNVTTKLDQYKVQISNATEREALHDRNLFTELQLLEHSNAKVENQLQELEADFEQQKQNQSLIQKQLDTDQEKLKPYDLDLIVDDLDDESNQLRELQARLNNFDQDLDLKMADLKNKTNMSGDMKAMQDLIDNLNKEINEICGDLNENENSIKGIIPQLAGQLTLASAMLTEMKNGSEPEGGDYWDHRKQIEKNAQIIANAEVQMNNIKEQLAKHESAIVAILGRRTDGADLAAVQKLVKDLQQIKDDVENLLNEGYDIKDVYNETLKEMDDCYIPVTIKMRANEIVQFVEKLDRILQEFNDLKNADDEFEGSEASEAEIKLLIGKINKDIATLEQLKTDFSIYQKKTLENYQSSDFQSNKAAPIIGDIRDFKERIMKANQLVKEVEDKEKDLNNKLIMQDFNNAIKLLDYKSKQLRQRLESSNVELNKINDSGQQMEDNTSRIEEDDFIEALQDEMPEVFSNINGNFTQLNKIDSSIATIKNQPEQYIDEVTNLKQQIDDSTLKIEQCEALVNKLENEMIEWDPHKKLVKRDEELKGIQTTLADFTSDLYQETIEIQQQLEKNQQKINQAHTKKLFDEYTELIGQIQNYQDSITNVQRSIAELSEERNTCFKSFDQDVPSQIKNERKSQNSEFSIEIQSEQIDDIYKMLDINCKYKGTIVAMTKKLRSINEVRTQMESDYLDLKMQCDKNRELKHYRVTRDDPIDMMMGWHLNKNQVIVPVKRIGQGYYLYGTKKTIAKINNGKLVIRLGGGYRVADEFIQEEGKQEINKIWKATGQIPDDFDWVPKEALQADQKRASSPAFARAATKLKIVASPTAGSPAFGRAPIISKMDQKEEKKVQDTNDSGRSQIKPYNNSSLGPQATNASEPAAKPVAARAPTDTAKPRTAGTAEKKQNLRLSATNQRSPKAAAARVALGSPKQPAATAGSSVSRTLRRINHQK